MSLFEKELYRRIDTGESPDHATDRTIQWAIQQGDIELLLTYVRPYILSKASLRRRENERTRENDSFLKSLDTILGTPNKKSGQNKNASPALPVEKWKKLADTEFLVNGTRIKWGDATEEQHKLRAIAQRMQGMKFNNSCIIDAERHERAAELIRTRGVAQLRELPIEEWEELILA